MEIGTQKLEKKGFRGIAITPDRYPALTLETP